MDNAMEIIGALNLGLDGFKAFVSAKLKGNTEYLCQFFYFDDGMQMTVLNYLIHKHHEEPHANTQNNTLTVCIDFILQLSQDKNIGEPVHQAIALGKYQLAFYLLDEQPFDEAFDLKKAIHYLSSVSRDEKKKHCFDVNKRDNQGRTLLSLVLEHKRLDLLSLLLTYKPNIHTPTLMSKTSVLFQPIHQAVVLDFTDGVHLLAHEHAQLANPVGVMMDTPLTLSARVGAYKAMEALLEYPEQVMLDARNKGFFENEKTGHTAMEELCRHIANKKNTQEALKKVAMLLCCGAKPPEEKGMHQLLSGYRMTLLGAIEKYLEQKPERVDGFVARCHEEGSPLHQLFYADDSFGSPMRRLFGKPSVAALKIENLVLRKYNNPTTPLEMPLSMESAEALKKEKNSLKLYAEFVRRYTQAYDNQLFTNRWSTMRWMIAEGRCDWKKVVAYARAHPTSRTRIVWHEMFHPLPKVHEDTDVAVVKDTPVPSSS